MAFETIQGTLRQTRFTNESAEYRAPREELRLAEVDLMQRRERVAESRRKPPLGQPFRIKYSKKARLTSMLVTQPREASV
jgi:predicted dithiol-disulfide oxidoreductase (DUF899 family)